MLQFVSRALMRALVRTLAACLLAWVLTRAGLAANGKLARVTLDQHSFGTSIRNMPVTPNATIPIGDGAFDLYVWPANEGTPPYLVKLTSPSGQTLTRMVDFWALSAWFNSGDFTAISVAGVWTVQLDSDTPLSWTMTYSVAHPATRTLTSVKHES